MRKFSGLAAMMIAATMLPTDCYSGPVFNLNKENDQEALKRANEKIEKARRENSKKRD